MTESPAPQNELDLNFHTDMPVGEILRRTRTHYGQDLFQVESILRIRASQLDALEKGDISQLPGRVYAIGFVRSYSEYLGLDGDKMVHLFKEQSVGKRKKPDLHFPAPASDSKLPNLVIIGSCIFGVLVLIGFISFMMFPQPKKNVIPPVPESLTQSELNQAPSLVAPAADPVTATAPQIAPTAPVTPASHITLDITDSSWVEIRNSQGAAILRQVLKPGDVYVVPDEKGLILATGNAGGITIKLDGKSIGPLGEVGQIKRKVVLDPVALGGAATPDPAVVTTTTTTVTPAPAPVPAVPAVTVPEAEKPAPAAEPAAPPQPQATRPHPVPEDTTYPKNMFQTPN